MLDPMQASKEQPLNIETSALCAAELWQSSSGSLRIWCAAEPVLLVSKQTSEIQFDFFLAGSVLTLIKKLLKPQGRIQPQKRINHPAKLVQFNSEALTQLPEAAHGIGQVSEVLFGFDA